MVTGSPDKNRRIPKPPRKLEINTPKRGVVKPSYRALVSK